MQSKRVFILEGADGCGKSTLARALLKAYPYSAHVHFGPLKHVKQLYRCYVEAMMPAVLGHADVVMDRCWLSEPIYGEVYRKGALRVDPVEARMLERLTARCQAVVVHCHAPWTTVSRTFESRQDQEMLDNVKQLHDVYDRYASLKKQTALPVVPYDYVKGLKLQEGTIDSPKLSDVPFFGVLQASLELAATRPHYTEGTAGFKDGKVLLVGEGFAELKDGDPIYQWPFASVDTNSSSWWLTRQLHDAGIPESKLCWVNADGLAQALGAMEVDHLVALGNVATVECEKKLRFMMSDRKVHSIEHPASWKRFHNGEPYPLVPLLKELLS